MTRTEPPPTMEVDDIFGYDKLVVAAASDFPATQ